MVKGKKYGNRASQNGRRYHFRVYRHQYHVMDRCKLPLEIHEQMGLPCKYF